jgi:AcrR family transcriptional regulator
MQDRLTKSDWIAHGFRTLAENGPNALTVGAMATALKVSRGSFYWHFHDVADFRAQILQSWQERTTDRVIQLIDTAPGPSRLNQLLHRAFDPDGGFDGRDDHHWLAEQAIRSWAAGDAAIAEVVAGVDASRIAYIAQLLVGIGVDEPRALSRAAFMYWAYLGRSFVMERRHSSIASPALTDIAGIFSR